MAGTGSLLLAGWLVVRGRRRARAAARPELRGPVLSWRSATASGRTRRG
ncbi:hypothetical protein ACFQ9X_18135 [Catenulispora yoronensis]